MTDLLKRIARRTVVPHRGRRIVVTMEPGDLIGFRPERTRRTFYTTVAACADMAMRAAVLADRAAKRKGKR